MFFFTCFENTRKILVKKFTFTEVASIPPATLVDTPLNKSFRDIDHKNGTPCFKE